MVISFSRFENFSAIILLDILYILLVWTSFFNARDLQVWSFDGVAEFLCVPFVVLVSFA
jgi:hypothetical protein